MDFQGRLVGLLFLCLSKARHQTTSRFYGRKAPEYCNLFVITNREEVMQLEIALLAVAVGYFIGAVSFARVVARRIAPEVDLAKTEIRLAGAEGEYRAVNVGANVAGSVAGPRAGGMAAMLDVIKVTLPTLAFRLLFPEQPYFLIAAAAGIAGHNWPVYYRFHGGSGFSPTLGGLLVVDPLAVVVTPITGWLLGLFVFRNIVIAVLSWLWLLIPWFWLRTHSPVYVWYALVVNLLFGLAMIPEARLALKYYREGQLANYGIGSLQSNPMGRGMLKLAKRFNVEIR